VASDWDELSEAVIGLAMEVHRELGPGLLESAYEECLAYELTTHKYVFRRQVALPVRYKGVRLEVGYRMDLVIENSLVIELKALERLLPIHTAQMITYLRLSGMRKGLLMNFSAGALKDGLKRVVL
jgi:GxxExxY protein